jgi:hypothetical protein
VPELAGAASDDLPGVLAAGGSDVTLFSVNMSARHPAGRDADFLRWHTFDHRPEHGRVPGVRGSLRLVSTPQCRAARAVSEAHYDAVDHVMTYLFSGAGALSAGVALSEALRRAGRMPLSLPAIERGDYQPDGMRAASRIKVGADVLPWWPARGVYMLLERGVAPAGDLTDVPGIGGVWWGSKQVEKARKGVEAVEAGEAGEAGEAEGAPDRRGERMQVTFCFLDDDPVATAARLAPVLDKRWAEGDLRPGLAAPFHVVVGYDCDRYLP